MRIVVVGGVAAGMSAAARAARLSKRARVTVFERGPQISYGACGLPYVLGGQVERLENLIARTPEGMAAQGVTVQTAHEVTEVDAKRGTVTVRDLDTGRAVSESYDRLLIATGVSPRRPEWARAGLAGLHVLRDLNDAAGIEADLQGGARRAVIVGGGYIGLEMAEALTRRGLSVTLLEQAPALGGPLLDLPMAERVRAEVQRGGVEVRLDTRVEGLHSLDGRVRAVATSGGEVPADLVLVAVGVRANAELAVAAGARLGRSGAVRVDAGCRTTVEQVYAAGDVAEVRHRVSRRFVHIPLGLSANRMGRVAAATMTGGDERFPGVLGSAVFTVFDLALARTGLSEHEAREAGLDAVSAEIEATDRAGYFPGARPLIVRLLAERGSGRLLGGQLCGHGEAVKRVDTLSGVLHLRGSVHDLAELDLAYAPPVSPVWDPVLVAARELARQV